MNNLSLSPASFFLRPQRILLLVLVLLVSGFVEANAFKLTPMKMTLTPQGRGASGVFTVSNDGNETLAVDVHFLTRSLNHDGKEINQRADEQFMVFPPQFALQPNKKQTIRVKWIGKEPIERELAFRLVAEQLPVRLTKGATGGVNLNVAIRYLAAVYVQPKDSKADIVLKAEKVTDDPKGDLLLNIGNRGSRHAILRDLSVELSCKGKSVQLSSDHIEGVSGENLLAGSTRRVRLSWPAGLPVGEPTAKFNYSK